MTIAKVGQSASVASFTNGTTGVAVAAPAGVTGSVGDLELLLAMWRVGSSQTEADLPTGAEVSGYTHLHTKNSGVIAGETFGLDTGPVAGSVWWKECNSTGATSPTLTLPDAYSAGINKLVAACVVRYSKTLGYWVDPVAVSGVDTNKADAWSVTASSDPGATAGDMVVHTLNSNNDTANPTPACAWPGCTLTNASIITGSTTQGHDGRINIRQATVDSGSSSGAPTQSSATTGAAGVGLFVRLRETAVAPFTPHQYVRQGGIWVPLSLHKLG